MSVVQACRWLGVSRSTLYRYRNPNPAGGVVVPHAERNYPQRLAPAETEAVVARLNAEDVADMSIREGFYHLLDRGEYLCSLATMHRIMRRAGQSTDRRRQRTRTGVRGRRHAPRLHATAPRQVWCWDITNVQGPGRIWFKLYVAIDLYSRYVVAHRVEHHERPDLAKDMFQKAFTDQHCVPAVIHADNGSPMRAGTLTDMFRLLHITTSHSRPRVSNDNPFAEAVFKTVKYDLAYPGRFDTIDQAQAWFTAFFDHYNNLHHHAGLAGHTPARVHDGTWPTTHDLWTTTKTAYAAKHPTRHPKPPKTPTPPDHVWINQPPTQLSQTA